MIQLQMKVKRKTKGAGLQGIMDGMADAALKGVKTAGEATKKLAVKFSRGEVKRSIQIEVVDTNTMEPLARIYTNSPFSAFLEWGTGIYMDENPLGHIPNSAGDRGEEWYVHEDLADLSRYNFPTVRTINGLYYVIKGTHSHPYMRPAAMKSRDKSVEAVMDAIKEMIRSVT